VLLKFSLKRPGSENWKVGLTLPSWLLSVGQVRYGIILNMNLIDAKPKRSSNTISDWPCGAWALYNLWCLSIWFFCWWWFWVAAVRCISGSSFRCGPQNWLPNDLSLISWVYYHVFNSVIMLNWILSIAGSSHQGHERFSEISRGRQCSFMSFSMLLCAQAFPV